MKLKNMFLAFMLGCLSASIAATPTLYVGNTGTNTVTAISTATNAVIATISVGNGPAAIVTTPDGQYAYVGNQTDGTVSVIATATNTVIATLSVGAPLGSGMTLAITLDGKTVYVGNYEDGYVYPITVATNKVGSPITVNNYGIPPTSIAFTSDGKYAYVVSGSILEPSLGATVAKITLATNSPTIMAPIASISYPLENKPVIVVTSDNAVYFVMGIPYVYYLQPGGTGFNLISPSYGTQIAYLVANGATAYALEIASNPGDRNSIHAITAGSVQSSSSIFGASSGDEGLALAITPNGQTLYVPTVDIPPAYIYPINVSGLSVGSHISIGSATGTALAFTSNSATAYVLSYPTTISNGYVTPLTVATGVTGTAIPVGLNPKCIAISQQITIPVTPTTALTNAVRVYNPAKPLKGA